MTDSSASLARLKGRLARLERRHAPARHDRFALGHPALDARLGGGLARGALHEICAASQDRAGACGFAVMLALRAALERPVVWVREEKEERRAGEVYGPGLVEIGANPALFTLVRAPDTLAALRAGADILACGALGAAILETQGGAASLDLTASRKLLLAAQASGLPAFLLRPTESSLASAAATRWQVAGARSAALPGNAPGRPAFAIDLLRHRGGVPPFSLTLEWDRDRHCFAEPALPGALLPVAERGQMAA